MSRRRRGNKLLTRILVVSVGAHVLALPILARLGVFEKVRRQFVTATVVVPPPAEKAKEIAKAPEKKQVNAKKANDHVARSAKSNLSQPKVIASKAPQSSEADSSPAVDPNGAGKAGVVPTVQPDNQLSGTKSDNPSKPSKSPSDPGPSHDSVPPTGVEKRPVEKPVETPVVPPHVPVVAVARPLVQPQPEIPDDLRDEPLDKTTIVLVDVNEQGRVTAAQVLESSGVSELDGLAIEAAKKWMFSPATRDSSPISSQMRIHMRFKVD